MTEKIPGIQTEQSSEHERSVLAHITFSRHEETRYTNQYPDITEDAVRRAQNKGEAITTKKGTPETIIYSPAVRARGTADAIHTGVMEKNDGIAVGTHQSRQIRPSDLPNREKAQKVFASIGNQEEIAKHHHVDGGVFTDGTVIETAESRRTRLYRALEYFIRSLGTQKNNRKDKVPHVVIVSHYELVSILLSDVFGDLKQTFDRYNVPEFGEHVDVTLLQTDDPNIVTVEVDCDGKIARRDFDRKKRLFA